VAIALAIAAIASFLTVRLLPRQAYQKAAVRRRRPTRTGVLSKPRFAMKPATRLVAASAPGLAVYSWPRPLQWLVALALIPLAVLPCIGNLLLMLLIIYDVTSSIAAARDEGSFDALLITPAGDRELARAIYGAFMRRAFLFFPALAAGGLLFVLHGGLMRSPLFGNTYSSSLWLAMTYMLSVFLLTPLASLLAYVAVGCWASTFRMRPAVQAAVGTFWMLLISYLISLLTVIVAVLLVRPSGMSGVANTGMAASVALLTFAIAYRFYRRFAWHLSRKWRTGRHVAG
ncbi:MAG: hypothetical protein JXR94_01570, partial [Candidatus Hydrogenedentes bacterium]|nr:hypothetical protein [Candidatus Hydrogenedentota bacterium]